MVYNIFFNSETAKIDNIPQVSEKFMGVLKDQCTVSIVFNIPIHY